MSTSHSPLLIISGEDHLGLALANELSKDWPIILISSRIPKEKKQNITTLTRLPHSFSKKLSAIIYIHSKKNKKKEMDRLIKTARTFHIPFLYLASLSSLNTTQSAEISTSYEHMRLLLYGELFGDGVPSPRLSTFLREAKEKKTITLARAGSEPVFLYPFQHVVQGIQTLLLSEKSSRRIYYLFPEQTVTERVLATHLLRFLPETIIRFRESTLPAKSFFIPERGSYELAPSGVLFPSLSSYLITLPNRSISESPTISRRNMFFYPLFLSVFLFVSFFLSTLLGIYLSGRADDAGNTNYEKSQRLVQQSNVFLTPLFFFISALPDSWQQSGLLTPLLQQKLKNNLTEAKLRIASDMSEKTTYQSNLLTTARLSQESCLANAVCTPSLQASFQTLPYTVFGYEKPRTYLLLLQNEKNLQPGGGVIFGYTEVVVKKGTFTFSPPKSIVDLDRLLLQKVSPPLFQQKAYGGDSLYLRDSNYFLETGKNAALAAFLYNLETNKKVDGVWYLTGKGLADVLQKKELATGDSDTILSLLSAESPPVFHLTLANSQQFFSRMTALLLSKDLQIAFTNAWEQKQLLQNTQIYPLEGYEKKGIVDTFGISEANVGRNEVNPYVSRSITHTVSFSKKMLSSRVGITYENSSKRDTAGGGAYSTYVSLHLPQHATLKSVVIDGIPQKLSFISLSKKVPGKGLQVIEELDESDHTYGWFMTIPPGKKQLLTVTYEIPYETTKDLVYSLVLRSQAGMGSIPYTVHLQSGGGYLFANKKIEYTDKTVINGDKEYTVPYEEKK